MTMPISTGTSYSSRSSIVGCVASISSSVSKRCTRIASRSPYGIGCRTSATLRPASSRMRPTLRLVWLLPQPVRTAQTATTGFVLSSIVAFGPSSVKSAPAASTIDALCMTVLVRRGRSRRGRPRRRRFALDQVDKLVLGPDRDPVRVPRSGQGGRVAAVVDAGDLGRREGDDLGVRIVAEDRR